MQTADQFKPGTTVKLTKNKSGTPPNPRAMNEGESCVGEMVVAPAEGLSLTLIVNKGSFVSDDIEKLTPKETGLEVTTKNGSVYFLERVPA
jgi:hypothetical protein